MRHAATATDPRIAAAQAGDERAFRSIVGPHTAELFRHAYRMLGSQQDAEDAVQETLLRAWRALPQFAGRSSLRTWLFRIATNTSLTMFDHDRKRGLRHGRTMSGESAWIEPLVDDLEERWSLPERRYEERESLELAFVAAIQHLTPRQRAVLLLREVLGFGGDEVAEMLDTNRDSVYSLLQRAHQSIDRRLPAISQQQTARLLGDRALQAIVERYVAAWEAGDAEALAAMLAEDAVLTMPPLPTWFHGRGAIRGFLERKPLAIHADWQLEPTQANGQLAFACYVGERRFHALHVVSLRTDGLICELASFLPPLAHPPKH